MSGKTILGVLLVLAAFASPVLAAAGGDLACPSADVNATDCDRWTRLFSAVEEG